MFVVSASAIMDFIIRLEDFPKDLRKGVEETAEAMVSEMAEELKAGLVEYWPSKTHPENVYATDKSVKLWEIRPGLTRFKKTVENHALNKKGQPYSGYADTGTTRKGVGTAEPWKGRGVAPLSYSQRVVARLMPGWRQRLIRRLDAAVAFGGAP